MSADNQAEKVRKPRGFWRRIRRGWDGQPVFGPAHFVPDLFNPKTGAWRGRGVVAACGVDTFRRADRYQQDSDDMPSERVCRTCKSALVKPETNWCIRNRNCTVEQAEHAVDCPARRRPYRPAISDGGDER